MDLRELSLASRAEFTLTASRMRLLRWIVASDSLISQRSESCDQVDMESYIEAIIQGTSGITTLSMRPLLSHRVNSYSICMAQRFGAGMILRNSERAISETTYRTPIKLSKDGSTLSVM